MSANLMSLARSGGKFLKLFGDRKMVRTLPYLRRVAYLESHGTEYIDTLWNPNIDVSFSVKFMNHGPLSPPGYGNVFGARQASTKNEYQVTYFNGGSIGLGVRNSGLGFSVGEVVKIDYNGESTVVINETENKIVSRETITVDVGTVVMFGIRDAGSIYQLQAGRIYYATFGSERKFIPVLDLSGRPAMYDEVSGQLFYNQGTGEFTWGELDSQTT